MDVKIETSWKKNLKNEFDKEYFEYLVAFVKDEYQNYQCFPKSSDLFRAFDLTAFDDVKVVILGQDPYHNYNQADGLSFSVPKTTAVPPSLKNIFKEIETDLNIKPQTHGNLTHWAEQGVLLLNAILSVRAHNPGSHRDKGWEKFTNQVIETLSSEREGLVFMLWGGFAKKKVKLIDHKKHLILESGHPSPLSANRGYWFGNQHFSKANAYFEEKNKSKIDW
ncbi:uracil-DNA glycosylase [Psychroflexus halocasei]|uniref:Uracil-DNA glycosylase n=1 Tax=Psychroflexus halocasei TaxID=908615 RepID=A0A1H3WTG0_9FLAO|nr:uracil-DNA glycosylase [Psychroflexus halocasei]SDZ90426.1 uracil-DNA glycosylase [Psychroflexus halocasei]